MTRGPSGGVGGRGRDTGVAGRTSLLLEARTHGRVRELRRVRSTVLEAEDAVRRRLERDLHDGAQQQILALALQSRLCAVEGGDRLGAGDRSGAL